MPKLPISVQLYTVRSLMQKDYAGTIKEVAKIGGLAHTALLGVNRARFHHALHAFLSMPPRIDLHGGRGNGKGDA